MNQTVETRRNQLPEEAAPIQYVAPVTNGTDGFTYEITDGEFTDTATVAITVTPVNDAPVAVADAGFSTAYQTARTFTAAELLDNDDDGDPEVTQTLAIQSVEGATNGTVALVGGVPVFTPNAGYSGPASFTYTVSDGALTDTAMVTLTVDAPVNTAPAATDDAVSGDEDTVIVGLVLANDTEAEGDALAASLVSDVSNGVLVLNADGSFAYTPDPDFSGTDGFSYEITDGEFTDTATVAITVNPVNDAPVAGDDAGFLPPGEFTRDGSVGYPTFSPGWDYNIGVGVSALNANYAIWGPTDGALDNPYGGVDNAVILELPTSPLLSLGKLQHANELPIANAGMWS